ncbi:uncharacterized protein LOC120326586 isoform X2 [Styela clava]
MIYYMSHDGEFNNTNCVTRKVDTTKIYLKYMCEPSIMQFRLEYVTLDYQYHALTNRDVTFITIVSILGFLFILVIVSIIQNEDEEENDSRQQHISESVNANVERENTPCNDNSTTSAPTTSECDQNQRSDTNKFLLRRLPSLPTMDLPRSQRWSDVSSENIYEEIEELDTTFEEKIGELEEIFQSEKITGEYAVQIFH